MASSPATLAQALDQSLDEAVAKIGDTDMSTLPDNIQEALALVVGSGEISDELLDAMDVDDPGGPDDDDDEDTGARSTHPKDNLLRALAGGLELRDDGTSAPTLFGHFSTFNSWYEIDSAWEGTFLERVDSAAFNATIEQDRDSMRVLYDHGFDPSIGNKPLGPIDVLRADDTGAYYEVPLLDTDYNRDQILPMLRGTLMDGRQVGSQLGASFRFQVTDESWSYPTASTASNPDSLPERTITGARVFEFGPVTFPASPTATAGVRSLTDAFNDRLQHDPIFVSRMTERVGPAVVERMLRALPGDPGKRTAPKTAAPTHDEAPDGPRGRSKSQREALVWAALNP